MPNGGCGIAGITLNKILKAKCIISGCVGKFWSKCRLTVSPFHNPANNSNSLFIPFISDADQGHFSVPMWSSTIASITVFVTSWLTVLVCKNLSSSIHGRFVTFWKLICSHAVTPRWLDDGREFIQSGWSKQHDSCSLAHEILAADAGHFESCISRKLFGG